MVIPTIAAWNGNSGIPLLPLVELEIGIVVLETEVVELRARLVEW
jgi:hypothetical protein